MRRRRSRSPVGLPWTGSGFFGLAIHGPPGLLAVVSTTPARGLAAEVFRAMDTVTRVHYAGPEFKANNWPPGDAHFQ